MHEFSVVSALMSLVSEDAIKYNADKVSRITVSIGVMSGIEPNLFMEAYQSCKKGTVAEDAPLDIIHQEVEISCSCGYCGGIEGVSFLCPKCQTTDIDVTAGEDMILQQLELELSDES